ncbi:MAG: hypothetical protein RIS89_310, partial [Bacteroidota bacterium]
IIDLSLLLLLLLFILVKSIEILEKEDSEGATDAQTVYICDRQTDIDSSALLHSPTIKQTLH